jgi:hypothetical protein
MLFSLNLLEIFPLYIINIFFFFIFSFVLILSYPIGRYFLINYCENSLVKYSLFSIIVFATIVSITTNLAPIFAKYVIVIFYSINLFILVISSKIRNDLFKAVISFKFILLAIFLILLVLNVVYKPIFIEKDELVYFYDGHYAYFIDPIIEILTSDYFSRLKIPSLYPWEWRTYHFFQASFNSIFLLPIYQSGAIGLIILKNFYFSIFLSLFFFSFFKNENSIKESYLLIISKVFLIILLFIFFFYPKMNYMILTNHFVSTLSTIFIIQSLLSKNKNDFMIWTIILFLSSFKNIFISLMLVVYYLIDTQHFSLESIIQKIKKSLNLPNLLLVSLVLFYLISTFYQNEVSVQKFHPPSVGQKWWYGSTTYTIIANYKYFLLSLFFLIIIYLFSFKYFFRKKLNIFPYLRRQDFIYFCSVLIIPFICIIILIFKNQILNIYNIEKLEIFFDSFYLMNLYYYFFVPLIWCFILLWFKISIRYIFIIPIIIHTFLSIFFYNGIVLPGFYTLEVMILFFVSHILLDFRYASIKNTFYYLFIASVAISCAFNFNIYYESLTYYKRGQKLVFKIKDLKELKKRKYLCPQDINYINPQKYSVTALSTLLVKPYYSNNPKRNKRETASTVHSLAPKKKTSNPCLPKYE